MQTDKHCWRIAAIDLPIMDLLTEFLACMRAKMLLCANGETDITRVLMQFHTQTNDAFMVNFDVRTAADTPSTIRNRYAPLIGCPDARLVFSLRRDYTGPKTRFHRVMSGVIVKYPEWTLLSIMPENPDTTLNVKYVSANIEDYDVYPVKDTTMVTLYFDGHWRVSTNNGIDASDREWLGPCTYINAVRELCAMHSEFSFDRLDKTHVYTMGFHHHDFHPLMSEPPSIELIYSIDMDNLAAGPIYTEDIGLPIMKPIDVNLETILSKRVSALLDYHADPSCRCYGFVLRRKNRVAVPGKRGGRKSAPFVRGTLASPRAADAASSGTSNATHNAKHNAVAARGVRKPAAQSDAAPRNAGTPNKAASSSSLPNKTAASAANTPNKAANTSNTTKTARGLKASREDVDVRESHKPPPRWLDVGGDSRDCDFVIETKLMTFIRRTVYDIPKTIATPIVFESYHDRIEFICLRAVLTEDESIRTIFPRLFPQFADRCKVYDEMLTNIKRALIAAIGCNGGDVAAGRPNTEDDMNVVLAALYDGIVQQKININSSQTDSILSDYVRNMEHIALYHGYFKKLR